MRRQYLTGIGLFLCLVHLLACPLPLAAEAAGQDLVLFYSNDNHGETEPCGCEANQLGGLGKRGFQVQRLAAEAGQPHLTVDAGDLLFKQSTIPPGQEKKEALRAEAIAEAYSLIGYDAVCVGSRDVIAGIALLKDLAKQAKFTWLSANLVDKDTGKPVFAATLRRQAGAVKATIIGLTGAADFAPADNVAILPWQEVLPLLLQETAKTTDLVILLSNLPAEENRRIAEAYDSVHILIQSTAGDGGGIATEPVNNTLLASSRPQGKDIGVMNITWQPSKRWGCPPAEVLAQKKSALDSVLWQLGKYRVDDKDPEVALRDQPERLKAYRGLLARERGLQEEIKQIGLCVLGEEKTPGEPATYRNRFVTLEATLPDRRDIVAIGDRLDYALNKLGREQAKTQALTDSGYLGSESCAPCHAEQSAAWRKTRHAGAYTTLADKQQQFNVDCLPCHVTGVGMDHASEALAVPEARRGVGCEACHGPGRLHSQGPAANPMTRKPEAGVCLACHAPPHDEQFDYERNVQLVH